MTSGVADVRKVIADAQERRAYGQSTYLLLDECHRWSKAQSDSILPAIERGVVRFIGSTTENPLVSMTPAIVSRCRIFPFYPLGEADVMLAMRRALADRERGFGATAVEMDEEAMELLKVFGLDGECDFKASNLPYGKQRKLEIARALATEPKLLLLDEPAAGMNPNETAELMETIRFVRDHFGMTILLIEHDMKLVSGICERLTVLNFGQVLCTGPTQEVLSNPEVIKAYLGE